jgi:methylthioribose-1-phosphate isomerase
MRALKFINNKLSYIDQTKLPLKEVWRRCMSLEDGFSAIKRLEVRGAPLIGVFAAYCISIAVKDFSLDKLKFLNQFESAIEYLKSSRPTAVNLSWALQRIRKRVLENTDKNVLGLRRMILKEARSIHKEDVLLCQRMAESGSKLINKSDRILTHCNAGFLATAGEGTALAVITRGHKVRRDILVYVDETRPLLQGARLTAWELMKNKVPCKLICDNMAAYLMQKGGIDKIFVGADRIAANGDTANKIGTYNLAVLAKYHKIPFYIVAPFSTFDLSLANGSYIPIEQRDPDEVRVILGSLRIGPKDVEVFNPAFDVTPSKLIKAIVTDKGIIYPPFKVNIKKILCQKKK